MQALKDAPAHHVRRIQLIIFQLKHQLSSLQHSGHLSIRIWIRLIIKFYLSGTCLPGWSRTYSRRAVKRLCVCVCVWL